MITKKGNGYNSKNRKNPFSIANMEEIDFKNVEFLKQFTTERGKILPRRITGATNKQQRYITRAIKRARCIALMAFVSKDQ